MIKLKKTNINMIIIHRFFYTILFLFLINYSQILCQTNPNFNFNNESTQGWSLYGPTNTDGNLLGSSFTSLQWTDDTNYPNAILKDPIGDTNGSVSFSCGDGGPGIEGSGTYWIMQFVSPDLSSSPDWQRAAGYTIEVSENMSNQVTDPAAKTTIWANLYVKVYDNDVDSVRYFYNGTSQPLIYNEWNSLSFNWSNIQNFPKNYIIQDIFVDIWGTISGYYFGSVYLDEVNLTPGGNIKVIKPNGGENWFIGNYYNIQWYAIGIDTIRLDYSTNNGSSWNSIAANVNAATGNYLWQIPNTPSNNCLVRIYGGILDMMFVDESDSVFSINPPSTITVTTPNGGENWGAGTQNYITWTSADVSDVMIEYSTDQGQDWQTIISNLPAGNGNFLWTVPNTPSTACLVKISDVSNPFNYDLSNEVFTISSKSAVTLIAPNGGENWIIGTTHEITWLSSPSTILVKIEYSIDDGNNWLTINNNVLASGGSYSWIIPNTSSSRCLVRISDISDISVYDVSDAVFSINPQPSVIVVSPNGGENWSVGNNYNITWTSTSISNLKIDFSTNNGDNWNDVISSIPASTGSYSWIIPNLPSSQCLVKISDITNPDVFDISNSDFTISPLPTITVTSPNGGEDWQVGTSHDIIWTSNDVTNFMIEYSTNNGDSWISIVQSITSIGLYSWIVPNTPSTNCKVRISDATNNSINDQSDNVFTINILAPLITVTSPKIGDIWVVGNTDTIKWQQNIPEIINIELYKGNNRALVIAAPVYAINQAYGTYEWTIPSQLQGGTDYRIKIISSLYDSIFAFSDYFSIIHPPPIADFEASPTTGIKPLNVNFTDLSTGEINTWQWKFGDDLESNQKDPQHIYSESGTYTVELTVTGSGGSNSITKQDYITVIQYAPVANFGASLVRGLRPLFVNFSDSSTGEITNWLWNFGDGSTGNEQNPTHIYNISGSYTVELTVTGPGGSNLITKENYIIVDSLKWNLPSTINSGKNVLISTTVPDYFKPTIRKLFYRMGGQSTFTETDFQIMNDSLEAEIPQDFITIRGIEYYILLSDGEKTFTFPEADPQNHPAVISVSLQNIMPGVTFESKKYEMISIPLNLGNNNVINFLKDSYGEYDKNNWRLFRWDDSSSSYLEYPDLNVELKPGIAFWLITRNGDNFKLSDVKSINTSEPFIINLEHGWNQVGDPFPFPVAWDSIQNSDLVQSPVYWNSETEQYESSPILWNTETDKYEGNQKNLVPWQGYFVYNQAEGEVILSVPPVESTGLAKNVNTISLTKDEFVLQIKSYNKSNNRDYQNYVGMINKAKDGIDKYDVLEPPSISGNFNLTIVRDDKGYIQNIVTASSEGAFWDLNINSTQPDKNIYLEFEKKSSLPKDFKIWFLDMNRILSIPVVNYSSEILLPNNGNGYYRLIIGKEEFAKQNSEQIPLSPIEYTLFQNYPNPFNSSTNIMYNLREKSQVTIEVFDILGKRVKVLVNNEIQNPGTHTLMWNGKNINGNYTSSGVYIYRIKANDFSDSKMMVLLK